MSERAVVKVDKVLATPTVHINGTSANSLQEQYVAAITAVRVALQALADATPHPRDYYVQDPDGFQQARTEHLDRLKRLMAVEDELSMLLQAVYTQDTHRSQRHG